MAEVSEEIQGGGGNYTLFINSFFAASEHTRYTPVYVVEEIEFRMRSSAPPPKKKKIRN